MQWRRFGSKSGGTRNGRGGCELKVGDKVYISEVPQFWEWSTKQCCERSEQKFFEFLPQIVTFLRYISRKWSQKIVEYIRFEGKRHFVSPPSYVPGQMWGGGQTTLRSPHPKFWGGDSSPRPPVIYATAVSLWFYLSVRIMKPKRLKLKSPNLAHTSPTKRLKG